jgi:tRNA (cytidine/uridine-2'-O-)-methyltransferase
MLHLVVHRPEIAPNTGNLMRLCVNTGNRLHLIRPYGFAWDDAKLRRAGLDYKHHADVRHYESMEEFIDETTPRSIYAFSQFGRSRYTEVAYQEGDALLLGSESVGLPATVMEAEYVTTTVRIPVTPQGRSLNLANAAAIAVYEAWRQIGFAGADPASGARPI